MSMQGAGGRALVSRTRHVALASGLLSLLLVLSLLAVLQGQLVAAQPPPNPPLSSAGERVPLQPPAAAPVQRPVDSERSRQVLRLDCSSRIGRRDVTLFANGTVRLRDGPPGKEWMGLAELPPDEMQAVVNRLAELHLDATGQVPSPVSGDWVETCTLTLSLPASERRQLSFGRYDTLPLAASKARAIADEMAARVKNLDDTDRLPTAYEPRYGDRLRRQDGNTYEVIGFTADGKGVVLNGVQQPVRLIVLKEQMRLEFDALLSRLP